MMKIEDFLTESQAYERLLSSRSDKIYVTGAAQGLKPLIAAKTCRDKGKKGLIICENEIRAREFFNCLSFVCKNVYFYPAKDIVFYSADVKSADIVRERFETLDAVFKGEAEFVVAACEALFDRLTPVEVFRESVITFSSGDEIDLNELSKRLVLMGYERCALVEGCGQFSIRGGIVDIFSPNNETPVRIELWGDEIDTIRTIDNYSQRSIEVIGRAEIFPFRELVFDEDRLAAAAALVENEDKELALKLREEKSFGGIERFINYFYEKTNSLFDYVGEDFGVFFDEYNKIKISLESVYGEFLSNVTERLEGGKALLREGELIYSPDDIEGFLKGKACVYLSEFYDETDGEAINFSSQAERGFGADLYETAKRVKAYFKEGYRVILFTPRSRNVTNIISALTEEGVSCRSGDLPEKNVAAVVKGALPSFVWQSVKLVVLSEGKTERAKKKRRRKASENSVKITDYTDLKPGDYVVHENHGIGIYKGLEQIESEGIVKDYLCLEYAKGGKLYVSVNQMELVQKYIGGDTAKVKLNSLGGVSWARAKAKASGAAKELAFDLVELYGKRQIKKGYVYSPDSPWQAEFEEAFPFEETEDQLQAVRDIKKDMEAGKIMDRLVCGDVGYGKTEVALRAAFKAINDGKQAAFLVPTTILANQHFMNIKERFKDYPITVEMLSRFKTKQEQDKTVEGLKSGRVDFVVGTHRLLSEDIGFKNLGLVIVDEEQRFGVGHKEKLKRLTEDVDVLSLSATPIPRTLHMSLSGIRDMSVLNEPPKDRLPVSTYVMEYSDETVRTAVLRELSHGGQVYYLHNRVQTIDETAERLRKLVPEAKIGVGHGQMRERELEGVLSDFLNNDINLLVCTTIIETGMDIQNVNTIIIENADCMGLSQLYQLRGRVGRTNKQAYCYLMYRKNKIPNEVSEKRLKTIKEFTEFGSGFKIALRDLEIRGAGDLLGASQHGHMDKIGYDMYCRILDKAIRELKGEKEEEPIETFVDLNVNAFIPSSYIYDEVSKLEMYKKISYIVNEGDKQDVIDELIDRFGEFPKAVDNLMEAALIKERARKLKITSIQGRGEKVVFTFKNEAKPDTEKLLDLIRRMRGRVQMTASGESYLTYSTESTGAKLVREVKEILEAIM